MMFARRTLLYGHSRPPFSFPKPRLEQRVSRRNFITSLGKVAWRLVKVPLTAVGVGTGASAYVVYKVEGVIPLAYEDGSPFSFEDNRMNSLLLVVSTWTEEVKKDVVPDWVKDSYSKASEWIQSLGRLDNEENAAPVPRLEKKPENMNELPSELPPHSPASQLLANADFQKAALEFERQFDTSLQEAPTEPLESIEGDLLNLTKRLIEIRNLLTDVPGRSTTVNLPSIVVIGSQSSGKSSLLEAIVGHEFLPKGKNMVTRRPIELTLVHDPESNVEFGEFPQLGLGKIKDFNRIQKTLTDLNLAVPPSQCVTADPIQLHIHSSKVPDLSLVDLPGYIQIHTKDQPEILKEKIIELCDVYIKQHNVILAVSPADVDLANSEALRASRKVDPEGKRTIGVITKMDLIEPVIGAKLLQNKDYHLKLGYIGVVCKSGAPVFESSFFDNPVFKGCQVGVSHLRHRLTTLLESHMVDSLSGIYQTVEAELDNTRYKFKVEYNDQKWTPEMYTLECIDILKDRLKSFVNEFDRGFVKSEIHSLLLDRVLGLCRQRIWHNEDWSNDSLTEQDLKKLVEAESNTFTKSGIGKVCVEKTMDILLESVKEITREEPWVFHPGAQSKILETAHNLLKPRIKETMDRIENMIRPFKSDLEYSPADWKHSQYLTSELIGEEIQETTKELDEIVELCGKQKHGRRRLRHAMEYLKKHASTSKDQDVIFEEEGPQFDPDILEKAEIAQELESHLYFLRQRRHFVSSGRCLSKTSCPEVYLSMLSDKLTYTAVLFIYYELLSDFFGTFPRALEQSLYYKVSEEGLEKFAKENPTVRGYLELRDKHQRLSTVMDKLSELMRSGKS